MEETAENRLKRLRMRSWRRGTKEMDLILGPFADAHLAALDLATRDTYEALLEENDQDLITWVLFTTPAPVRFAALIAQIADQARTRLSPTI